jgi:type I restriction enzyme R subunit
MSNAKEAKARIKINRLLEESKWRFFDDDKGIANIQLEPGVKLTKTKLDALGENFETETKGYVDYLLLDDEGHPIIVVEAKKESIHPLEAKEQARDYAYSQKCRFVILSNGNAHYFWDTETGNPIIITEFPKLESLKHRAEFKPNKTALTEEKVEEGYLATVKDTDYDKDPRFLNEETRAEYLKDKKLVLLRKFQLDAIHALQKSAEKGQDRYLFEMATGTGKTLTTAAICRLFLRTGNAKRVLFLVDRIELETQAEIALQKVLKNDYIIKIYKRDKENWRNAHIVVSTVQSLLAGDKYRHEFSPTDFELVISDEAHRSLGGNSRAVFEYFNGYKLGLTATPKDYLKNIDKKDLGENDPRDFERREMLDTYKTFGCDSGVPTFRYSLLDGVKDGFLVNPRTIDARTEVTTKLLSEEGYAVFVTDEEGNEGEENFTHRDYEHKFFNDETNVAFCKAFIEHAKKDPISGEIGKTLIFTVSQKHARKISEILNAMAHQVWEGKYNSDFAVQVTSNVKNAQDKTQQFANGSLNGFSRFMEDYHTSKVRVCVTVGMMTTGYDCSDILNLCLMRPIFSPSDFVQMKGRGTRLHTFAKEETRIKKDGFLLFDFFANCEYFEEKFDYDEKLELPKIKSTESVGGDGIPPIKIGEIDLAKPDEIISKKETEIGADGMRIDRELYFKKFEEAVNADPEAREIYEKEGIDSAVEYVKQEILDKPSEYFTPDELRKTLKVDRWVGFKEMLRKVFGEIDTFKSRDEKTEDEFNKFQDIEKLDADLVPSAKIFFSSYLQDQELRKVIDTQEYARLHTMPGVDMTAFQKLADVKRGGETPYTQYIPSYIRDYVGNLKEFEKV